MKSYDFYAVIYDGEVYCNICLSYDIGIHHNDVTPIFADSEWESYPVCVECGQEHDYVILLPKG